MGNRNADNGPTGIPWDQGSPRDPDYDYGDKPAVPEGFTEQEPMALPAMAAGFDPVLRLALIRKGILTPEDIKGAQAEIEVTSEVFNGAQR